MKNELKRRHIPTEKFFVRLNIHDGGEKRVGNRGGVQ